MKMFINRGVLRSFFVISVLFLMSCATTPDIRLAITDMTMQLNETAYRVSAFAVSDNGRYVASGDINGDVTLWDIQNGKMIWKLKGHKMSVGSATTSDNWVWSAAFTPDSKRLLTGGGGDKLLKIWDVELGKLMHELKGHEGSWFDGTATIHGITVSRDGKTAATAGGDGKVRLWDLNKSVLIKSFKASDRTWTRGSILSVDMTPDGRRTVSNDAVDSIKVWDNETGYELFDMAIPGSLFEDEWFVRSVFAKNGQWIISGGSRLRFWDLQMGRVFRELEESGGCGPHHLSVSKDQKLLLSSGCKFIRLWDIDSAKLLKTYRGDKGMPKSGIFDGAVFHPNKKWIITKGLDAAVRIKDMETDEEIALLVGFRDGEWLTITSEGYYNASEKGAQYLKVGYQGMEFNVDQFYDVFYRPDIVTAKLEGRDIKDLVSITLQDAMKTPPPVVEINPIPPSNDPKVKVCYRAQSTGGGIGEIRLFHNGKLIESDGYYRGTAKLASEKIQLTALNSRTIHDNMRSVQVKGRSEADVKNTKPKDDVFNHCVKIDAIPGENAVSVTAFNKDNTVQSYMNTMKFTSNLKPTEPHLYILSIGIDRYKDHKLNLRYAVKDSNDLKERLRIQSATLYDKQNIHYTHLADRDATKTNIIKRIEQLAKTIKPQDSFILFVAGHGVLLQNQYYILTYDYDGDLSEINMISSNEIVEMSKKIKSLSQLFIFDTCHAGGVDTIISGLYDARMSVLAKKMGLHIYASASDTQAAMDGYKGNGLFTHVLLNGLDNNREADKNKDGKVTLVGLGQYSKKMTTSISKQIGHEQTPLIINFGKDSPIYKLQ